MSSASVAGGELDKRTGSVKDQTRRPAGVDGSDPGHAVPKQFIVVGSKNVRRKARIASRHEAHGQGYVDEGWNNVVWFVGFQF